MNANFSPQNTNSQNWINVNSQIETYFKYGDQLIKESPEKWSIFAKIFDWLAAEMTDSEDQKPDKDSEDGKVSEIVIDLPFVNPGDDVVDFVIDPPFVPSGDF